MKLCSMHIIMQYLLVSSAELMWGSICGKKPKDVIKTTGRQEVVLST